MGCKRHQSFGNSSVNSEKEQQKEKNKIKVIGWFTEKQELEETEEEMVQWRSIDLEGMNNEWKIVG